MDILPFGREEVLFPGKVGKRIEESVRTLINGYPIQEYYLEVIEDIDPITEIIANIAIVAKSSTNVNPLLFILIFC